jgi:NhaA family Na+:H+ antiporter
MKALKLFNELTESEKAGSILLIFCTILSLLIANSFPGDGYSAIWNFHAGNLRLIDWINDGLMSIFFLMIGLELKREIYIGELSTLKSASLPVFAATGGMVLPIIIYSVLNSGTSSQAGAAIPMATDIAFAIGVLSLFGNRIRLSLKIFLTALAVIDDLGAILVIAFFYSHTIILMNLLYSLGIFSVLLVLNRLKINSLIPYMAGGMLMWYLMHHSGIHPAITGVLLAFAIPFGKGEENTLSYKLQHLLHKPVAFFIMPLFAMANTCIAIDHNWINGLAQSASIGILSGLIIGKPAGIFLFSFFAVKMGISKLPAATSWLQIIGIGILGGIGFTMSIFISILAFEDPAQITISKSAILLASAISGVLGYAWIRMVSAKS